MCYLHGKLTRDRMMAIILLQTHEQIPGYCTNTSRWGRTCTWTNAGSICLPAGSTNTHGAPVRGAHICTLLLRIGPTYSATCHLNIIYMHISEHELCRHVNECTCSFNLIAIISNFFFVFFLQVPFALMIDK